ncbi:MAG: ThiF family adenylyltransferase [Steroidobacteraceae bacterium]
MGQDLSRYHRQMLLAGFGEAGQRRLAGSTAAVIGCGALGTTIADTLARAGVGHLVLIDRDFVELTNLQRQVLYDEEDVHEARPKAEAARARLVRINSQIEVTAVVDDLDATNIERLLDGADVLLDGVDNFETRYLVNDYAVKHGRPYLYGGAVGTTGMAFAIMPRTPGRDAPWETLADGDRATACLRCLFEEAPPPGAVPTCDAVGVLAPAAALVANFEVAEALKMLSGRFELVSRALLSFDLWANSLRQLEVAGAGNCRCCRQREFEYLDGARSPGATVLCGRDAVQIRQRRDTQAVDLEAIAGRLAAHGEVKVNAHMLRATLLDRDRAYEITLFQDGRAIVKGTHEPGIARSVYARFIGT